MSGPSIPNPPPELQATLPEVAGDAPELPRPPSDIRDPAVAAYIEQLVDAAKRALAEQGQQIKALTAGSQRIFDAQHAYLDDLAKRTKRIIDQLYDEYQPRAYPPEVPTVLRGQLVGGNVPLLRIIGNTCRLGYVTNPTGMTSNVPQLVYSTMNGAVGTWRYLTDTPGNFVV